MDHIISASILSADFARLGDDVSAALQAGADRIHFDVMDHHYVNNLSFGPLVCRALRGAGIQADIDVHLMVTNPTPYIEAFALSGASSILVHPETCPNIATTLQEIKQRGMKTGIVFNPDQAIDIPEDITADLNIILLMTVFPGQAGQSFIPDTLPKIQQARAWIDQHKPAIELGVDGGINQETLIDVVTAGANMLVTGSALFKTPDYLHTLQQFRQAIASTTEIRHSE